MEDEKLSWKLKITSVGVNLDFRRFDSSFYTSQLRPQSVTDSEICLS